MAVHSHDDGFREIQLAGKQLVFLFMAVTVVSVAIFLCGVLVGRGVRVELAAMAQAEALNESPSADMPQATLVTTAIPAPVTADPTVAPPPLPVDDLSYGTRLEQSNLPADELRPAAPRPALVPQGRTVVLSDKPAEKKPQGDKASSSTGLAAAPGAGYAVQVAALNVRGEANAIAKRLASKGYAAYVQMPSSGTPSVFRVRVGTFKSLREAETMAAKLQREEQIKPWVTR